MNLNPYDHDLIVILQKNITGSNMKVRLYILSKSYISPIVVLHQYPHL